MPVKRTALLMAICAAIGILALMGPSRTAWSQEAKPQQETKPQQESKPKPPKAKDESKPQQDSKQAEQTVTITGCVQKGEGDNQYVLTGDENKKYALTGGANLALDKHVGKKVSVTGTVGAGAPPEGYAGQVTATAVKIVDDKAGCP